ncbi:MAG: imidazoleglycerol-phosphate dehydratase HisB [Acidimicrobiia bacterium]|nr:imidazoleglycerol-phosphate dehydratase HisB [Acidimicrobiia bacterium]
MVTRTSNQNRTTAETDVTVELDLDGSGKGDIDTGIGFLDHLLTSFSHHGMFDLTVRTKGDLEVDDHHSVEDTMLMVGSAVADALGDRSGIQRFGSAAIPMDEALATVSLDVSGRPYTVLDINLTSDRIGELTSQNVPHCLEAFTRTAGITLHIKSTGNNDHHVAEATFKGLAVALRQAVAIDERRLGVASTKGVLS